MGDSDEQTVDRSSPTETMLSLIVSQQCQEQQVTGLVDEDVQLGSVASRNKDAFPKASEDPDEKRSVPGRDAISPFDILSFQNSFYECIEELRIRRVIDDENEEIINQLVSTQHDQERAIKEELSKNTSLLERHSQEMCELRRQHDEKLHQADAEKSKLTLAVDSWEKETKELKSDIRTLQLTKHSLEKTIKDQDQRLQMQGSARSSHLSKMTELEALGKELQARCHALAEQLKRLEVNVKESKTLNDRLSFTSQHQTCASESLRAGLKTKTEELVSLRALLDGKPNQESSEAKTMRHRQEQVEHQLKQKGNTCKDLLKQVEETQKANKSSLEALAKSQQLSERHLATSTQNARQAASLANDIINHKAEMSQLKETLCAKEELLQTEKERNEMGIAECQVKEESLKNQLTNLQDENRSLIQARDSLEELNTSWAGQNMEMVESISELKEKLDQFERRESEKVKKENRSTNTESEQTQNAVESVPGQPSKKPTSEFESNHGTAPAPEDKDNMTETPQEKAVGASKTPEDSNGDQINSQIEQLVTGQVPITARCDQPEIIGVVGKDGKTGIIPAGDLRSSQGEVNVKDPPGLRLAEDTCRQQGVGIHTTSLGCGNECHLESASDAGTSKEGCLGVNESKQDGVHKAEQEQGHPCGIISEGSSPAENDDGAAKHKPIPEAGSQQIAKQEKPPLDCPSRYNVQVNAVSPINQTVSQSTVTQGSPLNIDNQIASQDMKTNNPDKSIDQPNTQVGSKLKATPLEVTRQIPLPKDMETNSQNPVGQLDSSCPGVLTRKEFAKNDIAEKSNTVSNDSLGPERRTEAKEMLGLIEKDTEKHPSCTASGTEHSKVCSPKPAMSKLSSRLPVSNVHPASSTPSYLNAFSRTRTRPSYVLPGFSLLTAQPRQGVFPQLVSPPSSLPPSIAPHAIGRMAESIPPSPSNTLSAAPLQGIYPSCPERIDKCPSATGKEGSQEWPNFAEEFDSGPNLATLSIDYSASLRTKPISTPRTGPTGPSAAESAAKRPAEVHSESLLFSDDDDETDIKSDVASQINRIQSFLRSDRLKRPRRSDPAAKGPVS